MSVTVSSFGKDPMGREVSLYTLKNEGGMSVSVTDFGAILVRLCVPVPGEEARDVVLGFDSVEGYFDNSCFFGSTIGPCANRIADAAFTLDGEICRLDPNDGGNNLHSHSDLGYHKRLWQTTVGENSVMFCLEDEDGSMGFPGKKTLSVTYALDGKNGLTLTYQGSSDKRTVLNPTNHSYFNLMGHDAGTIENHELWLGAASYTPVREGSIPTGEITPVEGTPMDFTQSKTVGREIETPFLQLQLTGGYDHNWVLDGWDNTLRHFATVKSPDGKLTMQCSTTLPGVQFYAGNFITPQKGKNGVMYGRRDGLCLETQYFPDSVHHPNFPDCIFGPDREYTSVTVYRFV